VDPSRLITVLALVTDLDEEYEHQFDLRKTEISPNDIEEDYERELERLHSLLSQANNVDDNKVVNALEALGLSELVEEIEEAVAAAKADPDSAEKAEKRLLEFKLKLDTEEENLKWPALVAGINDRLEELNKLVAQHGTDEQQKRYDELRKEADEIIRKRETKRLGKKLNQVQDLYQQVLFSLPSFWVHRFQHLEKNRPQMNDQGKAERLFDMGQRYLQEANTNGLRNVVLQLWALLPPQVAEAEQTGSGFGGDLTK
jgi:hypothetical protein